MKYYEEKSDGYFSNIREDIVSMIPGGIQNGRILEIGCGRGDTLLRLRELGTAKEVVGIELIASDSPHQAMLDRLIIGNFENMHIDEEFGKFDVIICADVLEHFVDPWSAIEKIKGTLAKDGFIVASIPNIRHFSILKKVFCGGDFGYEDSGILDRTHLRFFCKKNIVDLFENAGLRVEKVIPSFETEIKSKSRIANALSLGVLEEFITRQYLIALKNA